MSTEEQAENYSLPTQFASCRAYAEARGYMVAAEVFDTESGHLLERPGIQQVLQAVADGAASLVVAHDVDRFTRELAHLVLLDLELERYGARVAFAVGNYDDTPEGQLTRWLKVAVAEYESKQRRERFLRGMVARAEAGNVRIGAGLAPYGYTYHGGEFIGYFEIDATTAAVVERIFADTLAGKTPYHIATHLTHEGVVRPAGAVAWQQTTVIRILRNPLYRGERTEHFKASGKRITNEVPPIIDTYTWKLAQEFLDRTRYQTPRRPYLLSGLVTCRCGAAWVGSAKEPNSDRRVYYRCSTITQRAQREACSMPGGIRAAALEQAVWAQITPLLTTPHWLEAELAAHARDLTAAEVARRTEALVLVEQLTQVERKLDGLLDALLEGQVTPAQLEATKATLLAERAGLSERVATYYAETPPTAYAPTCDPVALAALVATQIDAADFAVRRQVLEQLQVRIVVLTKDLVHLSLLGGAVEFEVPVPPDRMLERVSKQRQPYQPREER